MATQFLHVRRTRVLAALSGLALGAAFLTTTTTPAFAANIAANPGFESGVLSPWTCTTASGGAVVSTPVHSGTKALRANATNSDTGRCQQVVTVKPSSAYTLTAWVQGSYVFLGAAGTGTSDPSIWASPGSTWQQLRTSFNTGASTTSVTIYVNSWYAQGAYSADDFVLDGPGTPPDDNTPPTVPANNRVTGTTGSSISLAWDAATDDVAVAAYKIYEGSTVVATVNSPATSHTVTGLAANSTHTYTVSAVDTSNNESAKSNPATGTATVDISAPTVPSNVAVGSPTSSSLTVTWNASTDNVGVTGYRVREGNTVVATVGAVTRAVVGGLAPNTTHTYTVTAFDAAGNESARSASASGTTSNTSTTFNRIGYFAQWAIYGRAFYPKSIIDNGSAAKLTHINYAFENVDPVNLTCLAGVTKGTTPNPQDPDQGTGAGDAEADYIRVFPAGQSVDGVGDTWDQPLAGNFNQLKKLKVKYPNIKVLVSLGGWTYSKFFSDAALTDASRKKFVTSCIDVWIKGNLPAVSGRGGPGSALGVFDGIDLDWEWPGSEGHAGNHVRAVDKVNNTLLIQEFRRQLDALTATTGKPYLLTAFTPADPVKIANGWEIDKIFNNGLDFGNVQGYDFHGAGSDNSWEPNRTGHASNLWTDTQDPYATHFSIDIATKVYLDAGVSPRRLTIGFPWYGRGWQQVADGGVFGEWQSANGAAPGQFPEEAGTRGYSNLLASVPNCTPRHDTQSISTYCYTGANGQWWTFDDPWSIGQKTTYVKDKNLLGAMIWELSGDTANGALITALDNGLR